MSGADKVRVVMMGTPEFAIPILEALATAPTLEVVAVVTQPDRPVGRKRVLTPSPVKLAAQRRAIPVMQPERVRAPEVLAALAALQPALFVTAAYGQILPQRLLDIAPYGCLNVHASLLPRWRGAAPIHRALLAGDSVTGVTIMRTVRELDAGPILATAQRQIAPDDNVERLHDGLASLGANLLLCVLPGYLTGEIQPVQQSETGLTYADRILRADEWIDWDRTTLDIHNHIRGLSPWLGATTLVRNQPVKLWSSLPPSLAPDVGCPSVYPPELAVASNVPGAITVSQNGDMWVRCADGWLCIQELQQAGRRKMSAAEWVRGQRLGGLMFEPRVTSE